MADRSISNSEVIDTIPTLIATMVMQYIVGDIVFPKLSILNFSDELRNEGETVQIPKFGGFAAKKKAVHTDTVLEDIQSEHVDVKLTEHAYHAFMLEDAAAAASGNKQLLEIFARASANALVETIEGDFSNLFDAAKVTGTGTITVADDAVTVVGVGTKFLTQCKVGDLIETAGGCVREIATITDDTHMTINANADADEAGVTFGIYQQAVHSGSPEDATIVAARKRLRYNKVNNGDMVLVSNLDDYADILDISTFKGADSINATMLRDASVGRIRGLDVFEHNGFEKDYSAAFSPLSIGAAFRVLPAPTAGVVKAQVLKDQKSGLGIRYVVDYDAKQMGNRVTLDLIYGMKVIEPQKIVRVAQTLVA